MGFPGEQWVVHLDSREFLGVHFANLLDAGEVIEAVVDLKAWNVAGVEVSQHLVEAETTIADYTDRHGTVYPSAAIWFWKRKRAETGAGSEQVAGEYRVEIEGRTSSGREIVALMRDARIPALHVVDGLSRP